MDGTSAPEGWLGEGRGSMLRMSPTTVRGSTGMERGPRESGGSERNVASVSPARLDPREPGEVPGLILHPLRLP